MAIMWHLVQRTDDFLHANTGFYGEDQFPKASDFLMRQQWLIEHAEEAKRIALKMRGMGDSNWGEYLREYQLRETISLVKT